LRDPSTQLREPLAPTFEDLMHKLDASARHNDAMAPHAASASLDLATLALLAQAGELTAQPNGAGLALHPDALARLEDLAGPRLPHYWGDLLYHGQALGVLAFDAPRWIVKNRDAELLGATRREVFPALCAVWLKHPTPLAPLEALALTGPQNTLLRLEILRLLGLFEPDRWFPTDRLGDMLRLAAWRHDRQLTTAQTREVAATLIERVFLVMGALDLSHDRTHFRLYAGLQLPPLPPEAAPFHARACRAEAYRKVITEKLQQSQAWRHVASGLMRCMEVRRGRDPQPDSLRCLDQQGQHLETDPRLPFRDCLFLANLGHLVPPQAVSGACNAPGSYVFHLDPDRVQALLQRGLSPGELRGFLVERCCNHDLSRVQSALPIPLER
jgi:hypothetical protein